MTPLHDLFCIGADGLVGHIAGFRLGRLPDVFVEWAEIAEALGHAALLVDTLRRRLGMRRFTSAVVHPHAAHSFLTRVGPDGRAQTLQLSKPPNAASELLHGSALDEAVVCLAQCVRELAERAAELGHDVSGLAPIEGDKIGGVSMRFAVNQDGSWTRAMRLFLINLHCLCRCAVERGAN